MPFLPTAMNYTVYNKLGGWVQPVSSFVLGLYWTADGIDIFCIDFALPYIMKFVALVSREIVYGSDISWYIQSIYIYDLYGLVMPWTRIRTLMDTRKFLV
jgi:hypothetical protein